MDIKKIKELIVDHDSRITLHDQIEAVTQEVIDETKEDNFPINKDWSKEGFEKKITGYEEIISELIAAQMLIVYWGEHFHSKTMVLPFRMIADYWEKKPGRSVEYRLPWYNNLLLFYTVGIAAVASNKYHYFKSLSAKSIPNPIRPSGRTTLLQAIVDVCNKFKDRFQLISGDTKHYVPRSEYLFRILKPKFEELLHLGSDYELYFDKFEIIMAFEYAHQTSGDSPEYISAPIGRFGYKRRGNDNPLADFIEKAVSMNEGFPPLQAGLIGGNYERFGDMSSLLEERVKNLRWAF